MPDRETRTMRAMVLTSQRTPLHPIDMPIPFPGPGQVLVRVSACGVCRTDLHILDGELPDPQLPLIPGHQIAGTVESDGGRFPRGTRVGVPWLGSTCGKCEYCLSGRENLCDAARFTGYHVDGGFAEYCLADERFCFPLPRGYPDSQAAPLLCAGLIGYRALRAAGDSATLGLYGFGSSASIVAQVVRYEGRKVFAFTRSGDKSGQDFARRLGVDWAGGSDEPAPEPLDAAIIFAPAGALVPQALKAVKKGGTVVCAGIHMTDIPSFPYSLLWEERKLVSVANLTRKDGKEFLALAPRIPVKTTVTKYPLDRANEALADLRAGRITGSAVISLDCQPDTAGYIEFFLMNRIRSDSFAWASPTTVSAPP